MQFFLVKILQFESIFSKNKLDCWGFLAVSPGDVRGCFGAQCAFCFGSCRTFRLDTWAVKAIVPGISSFENDKMAFVVPKCALESAGTFPYLLLDAVLGDQWLRCKQIYERHTLCFYHCHCVKSIDYSHHSHYSLFVSSSLCKNRLDVSALQTNEVWHGWKPCDFLAISPQCPHGQA